MAYVEMTEKQLKKLIEELEYLGFDAQYPGGVDALREDILESDNYVEDVLVIKNLVTGNYCKINAVDGLLSHVEFRAAREIDIRRYNMANSRMWIYMRKSAISVS